jgi:activator of HSP90 ATPase
MIEQNIVIPGATAKDIYELLLDSKKHQELTGDAAEIDPKVGGNASTFGGYATGVISNLVQNREISQTWHASDWPEGHYSNITFTLSDEPDGTHIDFVQTNLPKGTEAEFEAGWDDFYWQPLRDYFA